MISNQILQNTLDGIKVISKVDMGVFDSEGHILASTFSGAGKYEEQAKSFASSEAETQTVGGHQFMKILDDGNVEYVLVAEEGSEEMHTIGKMAAFQINSLIVAYKERFDKDNFIKNLLLDNLLLVDIYNRAKKLHIDTNVRRVAFIAESSTTNSANVLDALKQAYSTNTKDFLTAVDEKDTILVKEVAPNVTKNELDTIAKEMITILKNENIKGVNVAYGTVVSEIREVSKSYKEAKMAIDVGKIFYADEDVVAYSKLGIGRLIYQLPLPLCRMFIREIFGGKNPDEFDEETLTTINKFFENSLNVSETSRQLYIHRNTLVYRIDKLQKSTGLDLRVFDDAITFKIALMVGKYMKCMEKQEY